MKMNSKALYALAKCMSINEKRNFSVAEVIAFACFIWIILSKCTVGLYDDKRRKKVVFAECTITSNSCESDRDIEQDNCILYAILLTPPKNPNPSPAEQAYYDQQRQNILPFYKLCDEYAQTKDSTPKKHF